MPGLPAAILAALLVVLLIGVWLEWRAGEAAVLVGVGVMLIGIGGVAVVAWALGLLVW